MQKSLHTPPVGAEQLLELGRRPSEATLNLQRDLLEAYAQSGRAWAGRAQKEMDLWSQLAATVAASRSIPEAVSAYQACMSQRMQMAMDDGLRLVEDYQGLMTQIGRSVSSSWMGGNGQDSHGSPGPAKRRS